MKICCEHTHARGLEHMRRGLHKKEATGDAGGPVAARRGRTTVRHRRSHIRHRLRQTAPREARRLRSRHSTGMFTPAPRAVCAAPACAALESGPDQSLSRLSVARPALHPPAHSEPLDRTERGGATAAPALPLSVHSRSAAPALVARVSTTRRMLLPREADGHVVSTPISSRGSPAAALRPSRAQRPVGRSAPLLRASTGHPRRASQRASAARRTRRGTPPTGSSPPLQPTRAAGTRTLREHAN